MAADFIEQDGNIYLRLTGNTTQVSFNAESSSAYTYTMTFAGLQLISKNGGVDDPSYVGINQVITAGGSGIRYYLVTAEGNDGNTTFQYTTTNTSNFLCLGNTVLEFQNGVIAYPGVAKNKNLFVKSSGNWKPSRNIFVKYQNAWRQCEKVWIKLGGVWKESYVSNSSDWVNVLEFYDDTLDFAVQVVAQN